MDLRELRRAMARSFPSKPRLVWESPGSFMNSEKQPSIQINTSIPYNNLIFFKREAVYESTYELFLRLMDNKERIVETAVLKKGIAVPNYEETKSTKHSSKLSKSFRLGKSSVTRSTPRIFAALVASSRRS